MSFQGDVVAGQSLHFGFTTVNTSAAPATLAGTPSLCVRKNGSLTESTAGVTLTVDHDGVTGAHHVVVDTSADGTFYSAGSDFRVMIAAGTVGGVSVVGAIVASFSIENRTQKADLRAVNGDALTVAAAGGFFTSMEDYTNSGGFTVGAIGNNVITEQAFADDALFGGAGSQFAGFLQSTFFGATASGFNVALTMGAKFNLITAAPANWGSLLINGSGHVSRVTLTDAATSLTNAPPDPAGVTTLLTRATEARLGKLDVAGTLAHTGNASLFMADVSGLLTTAAFNTRVPATPAVPGDAMALTSPERTTLAGVVNTTLGGTHGTGSWEDAGGGGSGSGAYTVTVTVNDGATALQGATVRYTSGVLTYTATTNVSGVATFNLDAATYTVGITRAGYSFAGTTHAVVATGSATYSMTAIVFSAPADPNQVTGYVYTRNGKGDLKPSVVVSFRVVELPDDATGSFDGAEFEVTSHASTALLSTPFWLGGTYEAIRGDGAKKTFTVLEDDLDDDGNYPIDRFIGIDAA